MPPAWFILVLLGLNAAAALAFALHQEWAWALIYVGAAQIQAGCWWLTR